MDDMRKPPGEKFARMQGIKKKIKRSKHSSIQGFSYCGSTADTEP